MSKRTTRENKTCENCGRFVAESFCPRCGQENTEVRQSFIHLFKHFISDLLHYDSSFWSTIKLLLFSPATLSKAYITGKRKSYVDPIKLYIFISFIAFFIPGILPEKSDKKQYITVSLESIDLSVKDVDKATGLQTEYPVQTLAQLDSLDQIKNIPIREYYKTKLVLKASESKDSDKQKRINEFILHNLPKVLFIYMPIFAFWLWLFHNKKKFIYFDSGIFTLHYFSFLLLAITILNICETAFEWIHLPNMVSMIVTAAIFVYAILYFFRAHRLFYDEKRYIANIKGAIIILIDIVLILITFIIFTLLAILIA